MKRMICSSVNDSIADKIEVIYNGDDTAAVHKFVDELISLLDPYSEYISRVQANITNLLNPDTRVFFKSRTKSLRVTSTAMPPKCFDYLLRKLSQHIEESVSVAKGGKESQVASARIANQISSILKNKYGITPLYRNRKKDCIEMKYPSFYFKQILNTRYPNDDRVVDWNEAVQMVMDIFKEELDAAGITGCHIEKQIGGSYRLEIYVIIRCPYTN